MPVLRKMPARAKKTGQGGLHDQRGGGALQAASADAAAFTSAWGLLKPSRSQGNTRLYTDSDLERLDVILTLARDMGVNLAGIEIILNMREKMIEMERQMGGVRASGATGIVAGGGFAHAGENRRGMRLCGRRRGLSDSCQFSVTGIQFREKKTVVPSTVFPNADSFAVCGWRSYAVWRGEKAPV